jgi:hypothetical protein
MMQWSAIFVEVMNAGTMLPFIATAWVILTEHSQTLFATALCLNAMASCAYHCALAASIFFRNANNNLLVASLYIADLLTQVVAVAALAWSSTIYPTSMVPYGLVLFCAMAAITLLSSMQRIVRVYAIGRRRYTSIAATVHILHLFVCSAFANDQLSCQRAWAWVLAAAACYIIDEGMGVGVWPMGHLALLAYTRNAWMAATNVNQRR